MISVVGTTLASLGSNALNQAQAIEAGQYFDAFRIFVDIQNASQIGLQRQNVIYCKQLGKRVIFGCSAPSVGSDGFSATFYTNTYKPAVLAQAAWAQANGVDEFCIANEEELRLDEGSIADPFALVNTYYKDLATAVKAVYGGIVSFCISNGAESWLENIPPGPIDSLGFNPYGDLVGSRCSHATFVSRITTLKGYANWGNILYISEFNVDYNGIRFQTIAADDERLAMEMSLKFDVIEGLGITDAYPFCWQYSSSSDDFSMKKTNGDYRKFMQIMSAKNGRRFIVTS